jgi:UDP-galactopyranose mutase
MACSDLVFTGGVSLWEKRRDAHASVHLFPSSVDRDHFGSARRGLPAPPDLAAIPRPRLGWAGVLDERFDGALVAEAARLRPDWHWILLGPTARIDPAELPKATNLHYLGPRPYADLPAYLGHVDVGVMPFARNAATRYISPTKTPEYLAAGLPVVSTPIADVVRTFGTAGLVHVAGTAEGFVRACEAAMTDGPARRKWQAEVDAWLAQNSWDDTWARMHALVVGLSS